ncbi:MAG: helicase-associated domain-containing protein [Candidatus Competibacteraceae bacterium]|jgi:hypothetical protein|nr:helicase-associated domain-containing protein [Candidatus Competibacteraceae bacterium]
MNYQNGPQPISTVAEALQSNTVDSLKALAALLNEKGVPTRKAELIEFIRRHLNDDDKLEALWRRLDTTQQSAVAEAVHGPEPFFNQSKFVAKYGQAPSWGTSDRYGYRQSPSLLALFFSGTVMPDDLRKRCRRFVPKPAETQLKSLDEAPDSWELVLRSWNYQTRQDETQTEILPITRQLTERAAVHDLKALLRLVETGKVAVSDKTSQPSAATMRNLSGLLLGGDYYADLNPGPDAYQTIGPIKAFAWPLLLQAGGLAKLDGKNLVLTRAGQKALTDAPEQALAQIWKRWLKTTLLDELRRVDVIKGQSGKGQRGLTATSGRREIIRQALCLCPPGRWIAVDDLFRYMRATELDFEVTRNPWNLYISEQHYGSLGYDGFHDWKILQARYALCFLFEYASTLGLIDIAYISPYNTRRDYGDLWGTDDLDFFSRYDGLLYLRVNPLGEYCLGLTKEYIPAPLEQRQLLRVLPNLEIAVIGGALEPADALLLNSYAEQVSDALWKLTQDRLLEAVEAGHKVATLRDWLHSLSGQPLPETVERFLSDMEKRSQSVQELGGARLLECADAALAMLIANDSRTKPFCLPAGERHLVVPAESETRFRNALRKLGYSLAR